MGLKNELKSLSFGATPIDDISDLVPDYITTKGELYDAEFKNILVATNKYLTSKRRYKFNLQFLYKVHYDMFCKVWKWAGKRRTRDLNIGSRYFNVDVELKNVIDNLEFLEKRKMNLEELSAFVHHRLVQIHPFYNGNGRWARLIVNMYLKQNANILLNWPEIDLIAPTNFRKQYIEALQKADKGDKKLLEKIHHDLIYNK